MLKLKSIEEINFFIKENKFVILYFSSQTCGVCKELLPKIETLLKNFPKIKAREIEIEKLLAASGEYSVFTLPCVLAFINGKEVIREARFISVKDLKEKIERIYEYV
ncbi:thioredoxin family protein [Hathewaya massiliensis]|uniref:thioredoxin family protein n=1 Tax=Hathewaya massiliensis TaxID=1964382 RepID=UPI00115706F8|nr:thioredoxin family protein [Hathewaya massiliensis]